MSFDGRTGRVEHDDEEIPQPEISTADVLIVLLALGALLVVFIFPDIIAKLIAYWILVMVIAGVAKLLR